MTTKRRGGLRHVGAAAEPAAAGTLAGAGPLGLVLIEGSGGQVVSLLDEHHRVGEVEQVALVGRVREHDHVDLGRRVPELEVEPLVAGDREGPHRDVARSIADAAGARFAEIAPQQKVLYHAAAVFGSNYVAALLDIAEKLIGIEHAREDLAALAESAIDNWKEHTDWRRFTGPAARGEREVMDRHMAALQGDPRLAELYRLLAERILAAQK